MTDIPKHIIDAVSKNNIANDRIAFQRRLTNLETYIRSEVNPIEEQILLLREKLIPLYDKVNELRGEAKEFCTHPVDFLEVKQNPDDADMATVRCKFCDETFHVKDGQSDNH